MPIVVLRRATGSYFTRSQRLKYGIRSLVRLHFRRCVPQLFAIYKRNMTDCKTVASDGAASHPQLSQVAPVDIDQSGTFKYILIKVSEKSEKDFKFVVRGYADCPYHADIFDKVEPALTKLGLEAECPGGGRIKHDSTKGTIRVYGYSQGFGRADHEISLSLIKAAYPSYTNLSWSNEGY